MQHRNRKQQQPVRQESRTVINARNQDRLPGHEDHTAACSFCAYTDAQARLFRAVYRCNPEDLSTHDHDMILACARSYIESADRLKQVAA